MVLCRPDTFSLGVCNGCQLMALLGWVPGGDPFPDTEQPRFVHNASGRFECRWATVEIRASPSVLLKASAPGILVQGMLSAPCLWRHRDRWPHGALTAAAPRWTLGPHPAFCSRRAAARVQCCRIREHASTDACNASLAAGSGPRREAALWLCAPRCSSAWPHLGATAGDLHAAVSAILPSNLYIIECDSPRSIP